MNWYLTKITLQLVSLQAASKTQFEEQLRLVMANNAKEAVHKMRIVVKNEEEACKDLQQQPCWTLVAVTAVYPLHAFMDGAELFSTTVETEFAALVIDTAHEQEKNIFTHSELFTL
jgi:hypothetical protein